MMRTVGRPADMGGTLTLPRESLGTMPPDARGGTHGSVCHSPNSRVRSDAAPRSLNSWSSSPSSSACALPQLDVLRDGHDNLAPFTLCYTGSLNVQQQSGRE